MQPRRMNEVLKTWQNRGGARVQTPVGFWCIGGRELIFYLDCEWGIKAGSLGGTEVLDLNIPPIKWSLTWVASPAFCTPDDETTPAAWAPLVPKGLTR